MDKVLIVEDNPVLLKILQSGLKKFEDRFLSITAKDGAEAIEVLEETPISLLVTDLQMPRVDGLTLLAYMNDHHPEIPCVVMSAHGTPQIKEQISRDVLRFIEKPFEIEELVKTILPALDREELGGQLNGISIANFLQMIQMEQKTCLLEVDSPDGRKGYFYFEEGIVFDAVFEDLKGEAAALKIIPLEKAKIRFKNLAKGKKKVSRRIKKELMALIMDAVRLKDEADAGEEPDSEPVTISADDDDFDLLDLDTPEVDEAESALDTAIASESFDDILTGEDASAPEPDRAEELPEPAETGTPAAAAPAPRPPAAPPAGSSALNGYLETLAAVNGYRASAILNLGGEMLAGHAKDPNLDLEYLSAVFSDLFRTAGQTCDTAGFTGMREATLVTRDGVMVMARPDPDAGAHFQIIAAFDSAGNTALARMTVERMLPKLVQELG